MKRMEPHGDPCGMPPLTLKLEDFYLLYVVYELIACIIFSDRLSIVAYTTSSLPISSMWETLSNVVWKAD